ncbi:DUF4159 domain-containing protein [Martelella sp. HB161492]|uniref:DUF4159 domain-containing protein n=1 Tax=Martelella sp. HB161492 TaxID=2720726 RepID=UPI0015913E78|nr:DUF4159 domain-containing protein [Martelella sp. HB161492]
MGLLAFASPFVLLSLVLLPAIWWLLKLTPPRPTQESFPPFAILARLARREETPARSPWWLTLLRMLLVTLVILALADPLLNPQNTELAPGGPLALVVDNDWATAEDWQDRVDAASRLIDEAEKQDLAVALAFTAGPAGDASPVSATAARERLAAARPAPLRPDREKAAENLTSGLNGTRPGTLALISDDLSASGDAAAIATLNALKPAAMLVLGRRGPAPDAISLAHNDADATRVSVIRADAGTTETRTVNAYDKEGRLIASADAGFDADATSAVATLSAPFELRNDFAALRLDGSADAGGVHLVDDGFRRRRVALITGDEANDFQPLLTPVYYIRQALQPYADLVQSHKQTLGEQVDELLADKPSVIILADIGTMPDDVHAKLEDWTKAGGTLIRFAGPRLAASDGDDSLLPVQLRQGARAFGGAMSWSEPQHLAPFSPDSPFAGLPVPADITVKRQVLAEPTATLPEHTWASLTDGTPLVTAADDGAGRLVLFHTAADATWSDLPISGFFVEMLRRVIRLSQGSAVAAGDAGTLPPYRLLSADGALSTDTANAKPLAIRADTSPVASQDNPPGLYGSADGFVALNLFNAGDALSPFEAGALSPSASTGFIDGPQTVSLRPWLLGIAFLLLLADGVIMLLMNGAFSRRNGKTAAMALVIALVPLAGLIQPQTAHANEKSSEDDAVIMAQLDETHLAYVITGEDDVDNIAKRGLEGLSEFISYRTALEPGDPVGVDPAKDELAFYPLIYWPISATAPMPSPEAIARIDAYMRNGGTVLFDTRDQYSPLGSNVASANTQRLRQILSSIDVPPLEPVPDGHVLTRAFYLLDDFPGRYDGSPLWVEAEGGSNPALAEPGSGSMGGDGVSPIIITGNDFAGAWAINDDSTPMLPTIPPDPRQRVLAYRAGVNIVMYMLTGNYKADQVHVPALLERLGQ